jgi:hypothetical protein
MMRRGYSKSKKNGALNRSFSLRNDALALLCESHPNDNVPKLQGQHFSLFLKLKNVGQLIGALLCTSMRYKPLFPKGICCNAKVGSPALSVKMILDFPPGNEFCDRFRNLPHFCIKNGTSEDDHSLLHEVCGRA